MLTRGKCLCMYSIRATPSSRLSRTCSRNCSGLLLKCPPTCAGTRATPRFFLARRPRLTVFFICAIRRCSTTRKTYGRSRTACSASLENLRPCSPLTWWHLARRERTRVPVDPAFHPAGQRQFDRVDGGPLRRGSIRGPDLFSTLETATDVRPHAD